MLPLSNGRSLVSRLHIIITEHGTPRIRLFAYHARRFISPQISAPENLRHGCKLLRPRIYALRLLTLSRKEDAKRIRRLPSVYRQCSTISQVYTIRYRAGYYFIIHMPLSAGYGTSRRSSEEGGREYESKPLGPRFTTTAAHDAQRAYSLPHSGSH